MSIMAPLALFGGIREADMIMIYNIALGIAKMVMPTSIIVMTCTSLVKVEYGTWVKAALKPLMVIGVFCLVYVLSVALLGF